MKPNLICPGASKSATTTLCDILRSHPDVYTGTIKEPHFFDTNDFSKGLEFYEKNYYPENVKAKIISDFSPSYMQNPETADRIRSLLGEDIKVIIMLRNPIDRAFSAYCFEKQRGNINSFTFDEEISYLKTGSLDVPKYIKEGLYYKQVKKYFEIFHHENIRILIFEDFIKNMQKNIDEVTSFLKITNIILEDNIHSNKTRVATNRISSLYLKTRNRCQRLLKPLRRGKYAKYLFNEHIIEGIKYIEKKVFDSKNNRPVLSKEHRELLKEYYYDDVVQLRKLSNLRFKEWEDFL